MHLEGIAYWKSIFTQPIMKQYTSASLLGTRKYQEVPEKYHMVEISTNTKKYQYISLNTLNVNYLLPPSLILESGGHHKSQVDDLGELPTQRVIRLVWILMTLFTLMFSWLNSNP